MVALIDPPWPFSDPHSTLWLFIDPLDGPIDPWGSVSTTLRTTALGHHTNEASTKYLENSVVVCRSVLRDDVD